MLGVLTYFCIIADFAQCFPREFRLWIAQIYDISLNYKTCYSPRPIWHLAQLVCVRNTICHCQLWYASCHILKRSCIFKFLAGDGLPFLNLDIFTEICIVQCYIFVLVKDLQYLVRWHHTFTTFNNICGSDELFCDIPCGLFEDEMVLSCTLQVLSDICHFVQKIYWPYIWSNKRKRISQW